MDESLSRSPDPFRVSVVIPARDAGPWLPEALQSVLGQTRPPAEVVVVDDGSRDDTASVVGRFGARVRLIEGPGRGGNAARNEGLRATTCPLVSFLDADDVLAPAALEGLTETLRRTGADSVYGAWRPLTHEGDQVVAGAILRPLLDPGRDVLAGLVSTFWAPCFAWLHRRELIERAGGWSEGVDAIQDVHFLLGLAGAGARFAQSPTIVGAYRRGHGPTVSTRDPARFAAGVLRNARLVEAQLRSAGRLGPEEARALADAYGGLLHFLRDRDPATCEEVLGRVEALAPGWLPTAPRRHRALARVLGLRGALAAAAAYRRLRGRAAGP